MENLKILRKLESREIVKNRTLFGPNILLTTRFRSKVDLYANLDKVRNGIQSWKSMNRILKSKVIKQGEDFYYAIDENSPVNQNLENVKFLRVQYRNKSEFRKPLNENLLYDLFNEMFILDSIDCEKDHDILWRMAFIELKSDGNEFVYELFWHVNHIIVDGLSSKENFILLLSVIGKSLSGEEIVNEDFGIYPGTEKLFEKEIKSTVNLPERLPVHKPDFIDPVQAKLHSKSSLDRYFTDIEEVEDFQLIDLNRDGQIYADLTELVNVSREKSFQKSKRFIIYEQEYLKLSKKCKQEGVKITSLLNTICWIAFFRLYKRHNSHLDEILSWTAVSLRRFLPENELNRYMLSYCTGSFFDSFRNLFNNVLDNSEVVSKFWGLARENDEILTHKVANDMEKFGVKVKSPLIDDEMAVHTGLSNMGIVDTRCLTGGPFSIENVFIKGSVPQHHTRILFYNFAFTINNRICWDIASNNYFIDHLLVDEFIDLFNELVLKLTEKI